MTDGGCTENDSIALINGVIYPMSSPGRAKALFAKNGIIEAIGSDKDILSLCDSKTTVLDIKGKFLMPGMTDTQPSSCYRQERKHSTCPELFDRRNDRQKPPIPFGVPDK